MSTNPVLQFRPRGTSGPMYAPQRDLAYCYVPFLTESFGGLAPGDRSERLEAAMQHLGVSDADLMATIRCFLEAHRLFIHDDSVHTVFDSLQRSGFTACPPMAQMLLFARLGEVLTAGFFLAVRDVTPLHGESPEECGLADLVAAGRALQSAFWGEKPRSSDAEELQRQLYANEARIEEYERVIKRLQQSLNELARQHPCPSVVNSSTVPRRCLDRLRAGLSRLWRWLRK